MTTVKLAGFLVGGGEGVPRINSKVLIVDRGQGIPGAEHGRKRGAPARPNWRSARQHAEIGKADRGSSTQRSNSISKIEGRLSRPAEKRSRGPSSFRNPVCSALDKVAKTYSVAKRVRGVPKPLETVEKPQKMSLLLSSADPKFLILRLPGTDSRLRKEFFNSLT